MSDTQAPDISTEHPLGVYIHFPWCLKKCPYCDFLSIAEKREALRHREYADAVLRELDRRAAWLGRRAIRSIFFGGGTPSLWEPAELGRVLAAVRAAFPSESEPEITVECNPSSFDHYRAEALLAAGVNRVSIGVQSLNQGRLEFLGRLHDVEQGLAALRTAIEAGIPRVSGDLIFGVHGQSIEEAITEAQRLAELDLTHLSLYALTIEPGTQFGALSRKGRLPLLAEDTAATMFTALDQALMIQGFEHYEISNYARAGHRALHNLGYWLGDEYLGLGTGAWGTVVSGKRRIRYRNTPVVERYLEQRSTWGELDLEHSEDHGLIGVVEELDGETQMRERIMLGLRLDTGLDIEQAAADCNVDPWPMSRQRAAERLIDRGRLERDGSRLWLPKAAWLFADGTISELM